MEIKHYYKKNHKKTDLRFKTLLECNQELIKILKKWKGTPASIELIERKIQEIKVDLELTDPAIERIINPGINVTLNGHQEMGG